MCQVQVPISLDKCSNVTAEGATAVVTGTTKTLSYTILPGKSEDFTVAFDAVNFEMDAITATCVPFDISSLTTVNLDEIKSGLTDMTDGADQLIDGTTS